MTFCTKSTFKHMYPYRYSVFKNNFFHALDAAKHFFFTVWSDSCVSSSKLMWTRVPGYKNLTLNRRFLPFNPDTLTTLIKTY